MPTLFLPRMSVRNGSRLCESRRFRVLSAALPQPIDKVRDEVCDEVCSAEI